MSKVDKTKCNDVQKPSPKYVKNKKTFETCCKKHTSKQGLCHIVALPFTLEQILRQKKNYGNPNISSCKHIIFKKSFKRNQNPSRHYNSITSLKFHTSQNIIFQKSSYENKPIT